MRQTKAPPPIKPLTGTAVSIKSTQKVQTIAYEYWASMGVWQLETAAALLSNQNPDNVKDFDTFHQNKRLFESHYSQLPMFGEMPPSKWLELAGKLGLEYPSALQKIIDTTVPINLQFEDGIPGIKTLPKNDPSTIESIDQISDVERVTLLNIIGALLDITTRKRSNSNYQPQFPTQGSLINEIIRRNPNQQGLKQSTLEKKFVDAKDSLLGTQEILNEEN